MTTKETTMNKQEATKKIAELLALNESNLIAIVALADEHDIQINIETPDGTNIQYVPQNGKRLSLQEYWDGEYDEDAQEESGDYSFAGWQNSSTFC